MSEQEVVLSGLFRTVRLRWAEIAVFMTRKYSTRTVGGAGGGFYQPRDTCWVITRGGKQYQIRGHLDAEMMHELNLAVDEGRLRGNVDMSRFQEERWRSFLLQTPS